MSSGIQSWIPGPEDNGREKLRRRLVHIDSNLEDLEVQKLKFLCRDFVPSRKLEKASSALDIFDHLINEERLSEEDPFLLAELLYIMKQNLLLKYLSYTKEQVKDLLPTRKQVSPFRNLLFELSEDIDSESLKGMIFILKESLPKVETPKLSKTRKNYFLLQTLIKSVKPYQKFHREKGSGGGETETSMMRENHRLAASSTPPTGSQACAQGMCLTGSKLWSPSLWINAQPRSHGGQAYHLNHF